MLANRNENQRHHMYSTLAKEINTKNQSTDCRDILNLKVLTPSATSADPSTPVSNTSSGANHVDLQTAVRVSNFIDSLQQKRVTNSNHTEATNNTLPPPKSPSVLLSDNRYSSVLSNARSVLASIPVSRANTAVLLNGSHQTIIEQRNSLQESAKRYISLDRDSSDDDSSEEGSTKKDVGDFIDSLNCKNKALLYSLKAKLNARNAEREITPPSIKTQYGARDKQNSDPMAKGEKTDNPVTVETPQIVPPDDSKNDVKKDVNYYAILSQVQKAVQSENPALLIGKIISDAGKRGMKLATVTDMIKTEKLKIRACHHTKTGVDSVKETQKKGVAGVVTKEQLNDILAKNVDKSEEKSGDIEKNKPTTDIDKPIVSAFVKTKIPSTDKVAEATQVHTSTNALQVATKSSEFSLPCASVFTEGKNFSSNTTDYTKCDAALVSEVEARIKEVVRSATPSIELGKILADAKKNGLPTTNLFFLYKKEREKFSNAALNAASLHIDVCRTEQENGEVDSLQKPTAGVSMKEKLTIEIQNAVRSPNPPEMFGKILAEAKIKGMSIDWLVELYTNERMQMHTHVKEQGVKCPSSRVFSNTNELSDVDKSKGTNDMFSEKLLPDVREIAHAKGSTTDVDDFFSKFSLNGETKKTAISSSNETHDVTHSGSEESSNEIGSDHSELPLKMSISQGVSDFSTSSEDKFENKANLLETAYVEKVIDIEMKGLWKTPLRKKRISQKKLSNGGKNEPINGVDAAAALFQKRRLRGPRRTYLTQATQERTKGHSGFLYIDFYALYEATRVHEEDEEIDEIISWEHRDVRQRFLSEKSVVCRNWFGSFQRTRGNDRVSNPVCCPKSLLISATKIPESGDWNEDWYTTWKSRRDNPNNLVTFAEGDIPSLSMMSSGTTGTSTTLTESESYDQSSESEMNTNSCRKKAVLIEIGNLVSVRIAVGESVSKVHPDYTSSLRRSRWRMKYMRSEFAFNAGG